MGVYINLEDFQSMSKASDVGNNELPTARWWEAYLVRYFVGTIVGAICSILIIVKMKFVDFDVVVRSVATKSGELETRFDLMPVVLGGLLIGFCYCYLCSAPISVMHLGRYGRGKIDGLSRYFWGGWVVSIFLLLCEIYFHVTFSILNDNQSLCWYALLIFIIWIANHLWSRHSKAIDFSLSSVLFCLLIYLILNSFDQRKDELQLIWLVLAMPIVWIGLIQYNILMRSLFEDTKLFEFYKSLFQSRRRGGAKDIRDTYTHLREHSNAFFIVVVEICALAFIFSAQKLVEKNGAGVLLLPLMIWLVPTIFMWGRANAMEKDFSKNSKEYLDGEAG
jgi:hypothetical protein